jgi:hypothetical protein
MRVGFIGLGMMGKGWRPICKRPGTNSSCTISPVPSPSRFWQRGGVGQFAKGSRFPKQAGLHIIAGTG